MPKSNNWIAPTAVGGVLGVGTAIASIGLLSLTPPLGLLVGAAVGAGSALMFAPLAPKQLKIDGSQPTTVAESLSRVTASADQLDLAMRRLESRPLWTGSHLDEKLAQLIHGARTLAKVPALRERQIIDGEVQMLHVLATDYLPTIVNLAIENDRMHSTFSGDRSRRQVEANIAELEPQADILREALDRIETDVVRGTTHSVHEHAEFLQSRFRQAGTDSVLNLDKPFQPDSNQK